MVRYLRSSPGFGRFVSNLGPGESGTTKPAMFSMTHVLIPPLILFPKTYLFKPAPRELQFQYDVNSVLYYTCDFGIVVIF